MNVASLDASETGVLHEFPRFSVPTVGCEALVSHPHWTLAMLTGGKKPIAALDSPDVWMITDRTSRALVQPLMKPAIKRV